MICKFCGSVQAQDAQFCTNCGTEMVRPTANNTATTEEGNKFVERMHQYGSSTMFFIGAVLLTAGTAIAHIMALRFFNVFSIINIAWDVLPLVGVWMIYRASTDPKPQEGTLSALTIFRVMATILIVLMCIGLGLMGLGAIIGLFASIAGGGSGIGLLLLILFGVFIALFALYLRFYLIAMRRAVESIREGIYTGYSREIRGASSFVPWSYVMIGFGIFFSLIAVALFGTNNAIMNEFTYYFNQGFNESMFEQGFDMVIDISDSMPRFGMLNLLLSLASSVGMLLLIMTLGKFAESLRREPIA